MPACLVRTLLACAAVVAALAGCSTTQPVDAVSSLENTAWVLTALPGVDLARDAPATLRFEGGRALGSDGCNRYSIGYVAQQGRLDFPSPGAGTRMACPPALMKQADVFLLAVSGAKGYRVSDGQLQLLGADGAVRATFAPQSTALAGTRWRATGINNGRGALQGVAASSTVTLVFDDKSRISGSAGCNRFTGSYSSRGGALELKAAAMTRMACADEQLAEQEEAFLKALGTVSTLRMDADRLELRTSAGALAATFTREKE